MSRTSVGSLGITNVTLKCDTQLPLQESELDIKINWFSSELDSYKEQITKLETICNKLIGPSEEEKRDTVMKAPESSIETLSALCNRLSNLNGNLVDLVYRFKSAI